MNDKSKSVWTRPWQGRRKVLALFALLAVTTFVILLGLGLASAQNHNPAEHILPALGLALGISFLFTVVCWFIRWLWCWQNFKRFIFGLACLVTLIALFYAVENFRGKRAWENYQRAGQAKGEKFDIASVAPQPVLDDQNFAMQPIWVEEISGMMGMEKARTWYGEKVSAIGYTNPVRSLELSIELYGQRREQTNHTGNWQIAEKTDLSAWQSYYRNLATITNFFPTADEPQNPATDVLLALSRYDAAIEELRTISKLPHARFPLCYNDENPAMILLPHLASLKGCTIALRLRATAELQSNQSDRALDDIKLMSRLNDAVRVEPFLISHLVCIALLKLELQPIWEGLADHKWNDAQLTALDAELKKFDFLATYHLAMRGESAFGCGIIDYLRRNRREFASMRWDFDDINVPPPSHSQTFGAYAAPSGWFDQNKITICQIHADYYSRIINLQKRTYDASITTNANETCGKQLAGFHPYNWFPGRLLPGLLSSAKKFVQAQAATDHANIAISLERYYLAHKQYPETLDALVPQFITKLPHDVVNGQPLKYRRTETGGFILYSVGWNEKDDGGTVVMTSGKTPSVDMTKGDWVWASEAK